MVEEISPQALIVEEVLKTALGNKTWAEERRLTEFMNPNLWFRCRGAQDGDNGYCKVESFSHMDGKSTFTIKSFSSNPGQHIFNAGLFNHALNKHFGLRELRAIAELDAKGSTWATW